MVNCPENTVQEAGSALKKKASEETRELKC